MMTTSRSVSSFDPLLFAAPLNETTTVYPLGFPLRVITNSRDVIEAARESWGDYPARFAKPPIEVHIGVESGQARTGCAPPVFRGRGHAVAIVGDARNFMFSDYTRGFAFGWVTEDVARDREHFRYFYLEAAVYVLLMQLYLAPVHAACVAREGRGLVLVGESGAGKTCLAYACARRGWTFLSDDLVALVRASAAPLALGKPLRLRFRDSAVALFPELAGRLVGRRGEGKPTVEAIAAELGISTAFECRPERLVFLRREACAAARLDPVSREDALDRLTAQLPFFGEGIHEEQRESLGALLAREAIELRYERLDDAVRVLEEL